MDIDNILLRNAFRINYLRPYQELVIRRILDDYEDGKRSGILAILPTGGGKSLCFMYPILMLRVKALIIYPLLSLMNDQEARFRAAGIDAIVLRGGLSRDERSSRLKAIREADCCAVITNPETLIAMRERGELAMLRGFPFAIVDEAHTVVTWGGTFREAYNELGALLEALQPGIILAFTATADNAIGKGILSSLFSDRKAYIVHGASDRENIFYHSVRSLSKIHDIMSILMKPERHPAIIFTPSRRLAETTAERLSASFSVMSYHAGMERERKKAIEDWFLASDDGVLAATSAYGMGMDKANIRTVIHYSLPQSASDFLQESGRGGRDGLPTESFVLYHPEETSPIRGIFTSGKCIRKGLLEEMGEDAAPRCLGCSSCVDDGECAAGEKEILRFIKRHPFSSRKSIAHDITSASIPGRRKRLPGWSAEEAGEAIGHLIAEGTLGIRFGAFLRIRRSPELLQKRQNLRYH